MSIVLSGPAPLAGVVPDTQSRVVSPVALAAARMAAVAPSSVPVEAQPRPAAYGVPSKVATRKASHERQPNRSPFPEGHDEAEEEGRAHMIDEEV